MNSYRIKLSVLYVLVWSIGWNFVSAQVYCDYLRCFDQVHPKGVSGDPYFGWYINSSKDEIGQSAYQVLVASSPELLSESRADMWNSGKMIGDRQNYVYYEGRPLASGHRYYWKVRVWDHHDSVSEFSNMARFDVGLLQATDWAGAKWIKRESTSQEAYTYFRKGFTTHQPIRRAMVYVSAVHDFELYLDGEPLGKGPGYHYPQYQYYKTFDITEMVKHGNDHLFACLTHWYGGGQGRPKSVQGFLLKTIVEYADGTSTMMTTNNSWKQIQVPSFLAGQKHRNRGEGVGFVDKMDSRLFIDDWNQIDFDDSNWQNAVEIGAHPVTPWTGILQPNLARLYEQKISPISIQAISNDRLVIDLGKVYAGVPEIHFSGGKSGEVVTILGGYSLHEDGSVSNTTNQSTDLNYTFILNGGEATFKPMVYLGMRYLQVTGSPNRPTKEDVHFIARHFELDEDRSSFDSSNEMLNQVWRLMKRSLVVGAQESFVDTPTREKGGFLGDSWSAGVGSMINMGDRTMNRRILQEFLDSQDQFWEDGRLNAVYPNGDGARDIPDYTQMFLFWIWDYYLVSGDAQFLMDNFSRLLKVVEYVDKHIDPTTGLVKNLSGGNGAYLHGIIDWPATMRYGYDMNTDIRTVINAYAYSNYDILSKIAGVVDKPLIREVYDARAKNIKQAINSYLSNDEGLYVDGLKNGIEKSENSSQHANAVTLAMGIAPEEHVGHLADYIKSKKMRMGMVTVRWLPEAIGEAGDGAHLLDLYTRKDWDGWANIISKGATMTWESWDALETKQSLSHPWGAAGLLGIHRYILGVQILEPQYAEIQIKPLDFGEKLQFVNGVLPSGRGDIKVSWTRSSTSYRLIAEIPENVEAAVYIPNIKEGKVTPQIEINGKMITAVADEDFVFAGTFESGSYEFVLEK